MQYLGFTLYTYVMWLFVLVITFDCCMVFLLLNRVIRNKRIGGSQLVTVVQMRSIMSQKRRNLRGKNWNHQRTIQHLQLIVRWLKTLAGMRRNIVQEEQVRGTRITVHLMKMMVEWKWNQGVTRTLWLGSILHLLIVITALVIFVKRDGSTGEEMIENRVRKEKVNTLEKICLVCISCSFIVMFHSLKHYVVS